MQDVTNISEFSTRIADISGEIGHVTRVEMGEAADGSRRDYALVYTWDGEHEQTLRILSAPPWNSPAWAVGMDWRTEIQVGDRWMVLEDAAATREP